MARRSPFFLVYFSCVLALGVPVWWALTRVERAALPRDLIAALEEEEGARDSFLPLTRQPAGLEARKLVGLQEEQAEGLVCGHFPLRVVTFVEERFSSPPRATVGGQCAWVTGSSEAEVARMGERLRERLTRGNEEQAAPVSSAYVATFSLLSSGAQGSWDFASLQQRYLAGFLRQLEQLAAFRVNSQVRFFVPLGVEPKEGRLTPDMLPFTLQANEWNSDHVAAPEERELDFILYLPEAPLEVEGSPSNAFLFPGSAGVVIRTPQMSDADVFAAFVAQFRSLMGLPAADEWQGVTVLHQPDGLAEWEMHALQRRFDASQRKRAASTLKTLTKLLDSMPGVPVTPLIAGFVQSALQELELPGLEHAQRAAALAEKAFFHEDMLAMLYFPEEHKYAVYVPVFFPIVFAVVSAWYRRFKESRKEKSE